MTVEQALKMIKAKLKCMERDNGFDTQCNNRDCDSCDLCYEQGTCGEHKEALKVIIETLEKMKWIPVSEGLPEDEYVLISKIPTKISGSKWSVTIAIRTVSPKSRKIQWRDIGFGIIQDNEVLAWMPLPEPCKAESEE